MMPAAVRVRHAAHSEQRLHAREPLANTTTARQAGSVPQTAAASSADPNAHAPDTRLPLHSKSLPSMPSATLVA